MNNLKKGNQEKDLKTKEQIILNKEIKDKIEKELYNMCDKWNWIDNIFDWMRHSLINSVVIEKIGSDVKISIDKEQVKKEILKNKDKVHPDLYKIISNPNLVKFLEDEPLIGKFKDLDSLLEILGNRMAYFLRYYVWEN